MSVKPDRWIRRMALEHKMIEPFTDRQIREGVISYGVSSYGYDIRVADEFRIFTNVNSTIVDPKHFDPRSLVDYKGESCLIPPNSFRMYGRSFANGFVERLLLVLFSIDRLAASTGISDFASAFVNVSMPQSNS